MASIVTSESDETSIRNLPSCAASLELAASTYGCGRLGVRLGLGLGLGIRLGLGLGKG